MRTLLVSLIFGLFSAVALASGKTELTWYGHSAYKLVTPSGKVVLIDPWVKNPANKNGDLDMAALTKVDLILLTHGHNDHVGNSSDIARRTGAKLVATPELQKSMAQYRGFPKELAGMSTAGHIGGEITLLDGEIKVAFINALHGSDVEASDSFAEPGSLQAGGNPVGFLVSVRDGPSIYHTGDTDVFSDMVLINRFRQVDVMIACIGDKFTMGPDRAALATRFVNPTKMVIPMHYGTFPVLTGTPAAFDKALKAEKVAAPMREMKVGETLSF